VQRLSEDLNFQYVIYVVNDTNYGDFRDGKWTGMVGDVIGGSADLIVGAFSVTSARQQVIGFTEPYYHNEFSIVTGEDGRSPSIWAFLSPFSAQVIINLRYTVIIIQ
jgi:ABC-type amino acid transport substrate-binding protein